MSRELVHRGPDDDGHYVDSRGRAGLAFRRLSIIDLADGRQPMSNEDGTIWIVFNGEIYNFRELRERLSGLGHEFKTRCDAEVIVHAYEQFGDACFAEFAGMFAIAIWDEVRGRLLLGRDRLGQKPLACAVINNRFYFASEIKAILALPGVPREIDLQSLHRYLIFQYVPAPHSVYKNFGKLPPGRRMTVVAGQPFTWEFRPYWRLRPDARFDGSYEEAKERLGELLTRAVEKRLVADVPLGAFLSGGVDSSIVVALMHKLGAAPLRTFSIGFEDARYNEAPHACRVAEMFGAEHHEHIVTPEAQSILDTLAYHYDEPFADSSAIPTYYVAQWTRQSVAVALTGDAGDECFAGYDRYRALQLAGRFAWLPAPVRSGVAAAAALLPHTMPRSPSNRAYRFLRALRLSAMQQYVQWISVFPPEMLRAGYTDDTADRLDLDEPIRWFAGMFDSAGTPTDRAIRADIHSYLPYDLLTKVDIASMAVSLECRCPFLDHELVQFAASLPLEWRLGRLGTKHILKDWAVDLLPREILMRPKQGFGVPVGQWFREELRDLLQSRVLGSDSLSMRLFRRDRLEELIAEHQSKRANHEHRLWALLMLELWAERWSPTFA